MQQQRLAFTMKETADLLGVNYHTVYRLAKRRLLRPSGALRIKLFAKTEIERFLADSQENRLSDETVTQS